MTATTKRPDDRLSRVLSALARHERQLNDTAAEMSYYGVASDFAEDGFFDRAADKRYDILADHGFTAESIHEAFADSLGLDLTWDAPARYEPQVWTPHYRGISYGQYRLLTLIPEQPEIAEWNRAMAGTP